MSDAKSNSWIVDSGCTNYMCNSKSAFKFLKQLDCPVQIEVGNGKFVVGTGKGDVELKLSLPHGETKVCTLKSVLFVPDLAYNLISVSQISEFGKIATFNNVTCKITDCKNKLIAVPRKCGKLFILDLSCDFAGKCTTAVNHNSDHSQSSEQLWHRRFCHLGASNLRKLKGKNLVIGLDCEVSSNPFFCKNCVDGKLSRTQFPKLDGNKHRDTFELIHSDVCGKLVPLSMGGND